MCELSCIHDECRVRVSTEDTGLKLEKEAATSSELVTIKNI